MKKTTCFLAGRYLLSIPDTQYTVSITVVLLYYVLRKDLPKLLLLE